MFRPQSTGSLYISLHGGGGAPKRVNDRQWTNQKRLYRVEEGVYLAPRAPTDTWNMWHQAHIDGLFYRLIENLIVFEDVDPNRVYLLGYSADGDGVYQLAPRMAKHTRNPLPNCIVWRQDDVTHSRFYWLAVKPQERRAGVVVRASLKGQQFDVQAGGINQLIIRANDSMLNLDEDVTVMSQAKELYKGRIQRSIGTLAETLAERGDPTSIFSGGIVVRLTNETEI